MIVAGGASQRLLIDHLAERIEEGRVPALDRDARQRAFEPEPRKLLGGVRQQIDADPDGLDLGCRLEDPAGNVRRVQREPQRQPADAAADDNDVVHVSVPRAFADDETRLVSPLSIWPLYPYHLAPLMSAEARLRAKADAGRGRSRRASGEGESPRTPPLQNLRQRPLTPPSPRKRGAREKCLSAIAQFEFLAAFHETHAHPRRRARPLAREALGAGPGTEAAIVFGGVGVLQIAMRAPAVLIFGAGKLGAAAQLRTAGEAARIIRTPSIAQRGKDIAAADLIAEEMRRRRHHRRV